MVGESIEVAESACATTFECNAGNERGIPMTKSWRLFNGAQTFEGTKDYCTLSSLKLGSVIAMYDVFYNSSVSMFTQWKNPRHLEWVCPHCPTVLVLLRRLVIRMYVPTSG